MSILILNRHSNRTSPYYEWLHQLQKPMVMLCDNRRKDAVDNRYDHIQFFDNWEVNGNIERVALELHKRYQFDTIIATSESDIIRASMLREILGIRGQSVKSAIAYRDKVQMKIYLQEKGISVPTFAKVNHPVDLVRFCNQVGFPVVHKPIASSGSENTVILRSWEDVSKTLENTAFTNTAYEVETFVDGEMYHVDGVWNKGDIEFACTSKYINGCLAFHSGKYLGSYLLDENDPLFMHLVSFAKEVLSALPSPEATPFHCEVFVTPEGEFVLCEIASRAGGARVIDTINHAYGYHLIEQGVLAQCNIDTKSTPKRDISAGWLLFPPRRGRITRVPCPPSITGIIDFQVTAQVGDVYEHAGSSVDNILSAIVSGSSSEEVRNRIDTLAQEVSKQFKWDEWSEEQAGILR